MLSRSIRHGQPDRNEVWIDVQIRGQEDREPVFSIALTQMSEHNSGFHNIGSYILKAVRGRIAADKVTASEIDVAAIAKQLGQTEEKVAKALRGIV